MKTPCVKRRYGHSKGFYLTDNDKEMLTYLSRVYGQNPSAVMRKLITEAYAILRYVEQKK